MTDMTRPIAVYGATGYTGKLVAAELQRRGLPTVLAGRSADKLRAVAAAVGLPADAVRVAGTDDPAALRAAFAGCAVVISCAGPFTPCGEPVVEAAIAAGAHYIDTTGEQPFIRMVLDRHGPAAERAGVGLVPGMGFDYLPGDLLCALAAEGLGHLSEITIAYALAGFGATRGTTKSAFLMMGDAPLRQPLGYRFSFPAPLGLRLMANYPSGELVTVPRHVDVDRVTAIITSSTFAPHPRLDFAVPVITPAIALLLRTPIRGVLDRAVDRLPEGPPEEDRRAAAYTLVAVARTADGTQRRLVLRGTDVYGITAVTTVHGASLMAGPGYARSGGLAPAQAYDARAFLAALEPHGVTVTEPVTVT